MFHKLTAAAQAARKLVFTATLALLLALSASVAFAWGFPGEGSLTAAVVKAVENCKQKVETARAALAVDGSSANWSKLEVALKDLEAVKAQAATINGRVEKLKRATNVNRADIKRLYDDVLALKGLTKADHEQLVRLTGMAINLNSRVVSLEGTVPAVAAQAARAERKADEALASSADIDGTLAAFTGKGPGSGESGLQFAFCARGKQSGIGGCASATTGFVGIIDDKDPHPTSVLVKVGPSFRIGDTESPFELGLHGIMGTGAPTSLSVDPRLVAGFGAGFNFRFSRISSVPLTLGFELGTAFGGWEGAIGGVTLGFDLVSASKLANRKKAVDGAVEQAPQATPPLATPEAPPVAE